MKGKSINGICFVQWWKLVLNDPQINHDIQEIIMAFNDFERLKRRSLEKKNMYMIKIISDNARIHLAIKTQISTGYLKLNIYMLPPYSPQLALLEWIFGMIKRIILTMKSVITIDFSKKSEEIAIHQALGRINENLGKIIWLKFIMESKNVIIEWMKRLKVTKIIENDDRET